MGQPRALFAGIILLMLGAERAGAQGPQKPPDPEAGHRLAVQFCSSCHLVGPEQKGPVPDGVATFESIASQPNVSADYLKTTLMAEQHPMMPQPPLTTQQLEDVGAYIVSLGP